MGKVKSGMRFGRLTAIEKCRGDSWICRCDCGNKTTVFQRNLIHNHTRSCGCLREKKRPYLHRAHGLSGTRLYEIYNGMLKRCYNSNSKFYNRYGGRGIFVCNEWVSNFESFKNWALSHGYRADLSIDRIDNDGPYSPENCRWATHGEQRRNRRDIVSICCNGEMMCLTDAAAFVGLKPATLRKRIKELGWSVEKALNTPVRQ